MSRDELSGPDLAGVIADANAVGLEHVVIGGFSVIYHGYIRATTGQSDLLVSDGPETDAAIVRFLDRVEATRFSDGEKLAIENVADRHHLRVNTRHGIVDIMRGGLEPLDYETVASRAVRDEWQGQAVRIAALPSVVGFKRLARRGQDRADLEELEAIHGELPIEPIPGLDS
jgi:hypothetical protein